MKQVPKVGTFVGTGAPLDISLGFVPEYIRIVNITDGNAAGEWFAGTMPDNSAIVTNATGDMSKITTNGVKAFTGSATKARGFSVGTAFSVSGKTYSYFAVRGDD